MSWKIGDVFFWTYKDPPTMTDPYWCKSRIGIVSEQGRLVDTYWHGSNNASWSAEDAIAELDLEFKGNLSDYEKQRESERVNYEDADILDLNHANSTRGNFYIRKGATKSRAKMLTVAYDKLHMAHGELSSAARNVEWIARQIGKLEGGEDLDKVLL